MGEDVSPLGRIATLHFYDGADIQYVGPGAGHRLPVDVEAAILPTDAATQTTLAALLVELALKANLLETQPVSLASIPTGAVTIADGSDIAEGAVADAVVAAGAAGSLSAKLRRLTTDLNALNALIGALSTPAGGSVNYQLNEIDDALGAVGGGDAGTLLAYLLEIQSRLGDETAPAAGTLAKLLTDALTALEKIDDLQGALVTEAADELRVVHIQARPGTAHIDKAERQGSVNGSTTVEVLATTVGKGEVLGAQFSANHIDCQLRLTLDGRSIDTIFNTGAGYDWLDPYQLNEWGGENSFWKQAVYDTDNNHYAFFLKRPIPYDTSIKIEVTNGDASAHNIALRMWYSLYT